MLMIIANKNFFLSLQKIYTKFHFKDEFVM
jgi:hypothetical protein